MKRLLCIVSFVFISSISFAADKVTVFAASSATDMLTELMDVYNKQYKSNVIASFASSGVLAKQIEEGAPADIFISANQEWMDYLAEKSLLKADSRKNWLGNTLVLIAPKASNISYKIVKNASLAELLAGGKLAMGDPAYVPAGTYGKQAMQNLGIWADIEKNITASENVRAVLMLVVRGESPLGVVFGSDYLAAKDDVKLVDSFPADSFDTISYPISIIKNHDNAEVQKFYDFLQSEAAKTIINKHSFVLL